MKDLYYMKTYTLSDFIKEYALDPTGKLIKGRHYLKFWTARATNGAELYKELMDYSLGSPTFTQAVYNYVNKMNISSCKV